MDSINYIQNKEVIPNTHFFVYKNKKYPIKFDYFKYASKYFATYQDDFEMKKDLELLDQETAKKIDIKEDTINDFINFVQSERIKLSKENAVWLNYLSTRYEVITLQKITNKFIEQHENELILDIIKEHQDEKNFDTSKYENIISNHIEKYIDDERLLDLNITILYRIFKQYFKNKESKEEKVEIQIQNFLFKILAKRGHQASVLFEEVNFGKQRKECLNTLISKYSHIFNFQFITAELLKMIAENEKEIEMLKEENKQAISNKNNEISQLKEENKQMEMIIEQKESQHCKELKEQKQELSKIIVHYKEIISNKDKEIAEMKDIIEKNQLKFDKQKKSYLDQIDELKNQANPIHCPCGIFKYLFKKYKNNPIKNGLVEIKGASLDMEWDENLLNIIDPSCDKYWIPKEEENAFFMIVFKTFTVNINKYHLRIGSEFGEFIFKSWELCGITEDNHEIILDSVNNCQEITSDHPETTIVIKNDQFIRSIKFIIKGKNEFDEYTFDIGNIEFYGYIKNDTKS